MAVGGIVGDILKATDKNSPIILAGLAVVGVIATAVLTAKAVPKALKAIEEEEIARKEAAEERAKNEEKILGKDYQEVYDDIYEPVNNKDRFKIGFKYFIPPIICGVLTIGCVVGSEKINYVRQAAMTASYELLRTTYDEYRYHVREQLGNSKTEKIEHNLHEKKSNDVLEKNPVSQKEFDILDVKAGAALFVDQVSGHRFVSTYEKVYRAVDEVNDILEHGQEDFVSLPKFLEICGDDDNEYASGLHNMGFYALPFQKRIDRQHICEPIVGEHKGHTCTIVYLNLGVLDDRNFIR